MKRSIQILLFFFVSLPFAAHSGIPGFMKNRMGTLSGQVITEEGLSIHEGRVSFFDTKQGIPPLVGGMHRIPDMIGKIGQDGKFSIRLLPGSYYMGVLVTSDPKRGPGPPREGEIFYFARNKKGGLLELSIGAKEEKDVGKVISALPDTFPLVQNLVTIEGRLVKEDGSPFAGGVVVAKKDLNKFRPDFVSERTDENGSFSIKLPADTAYYLTGRERAVGRPVPGTLMGTYGSTTPISEGGALPIGNLTPAQPASGLPQLDGVELGPGENNPRMVTGKKGETITDIDIMMFKVPVPGELREKLQGTLGFGDEFREQMNKNFPLKTEPAQQNTDQEQRR